MARTQTETCGEDRDGHDVVDIAPFQNRRDDRRNKNGRDHRKHEYEKTPVRFPEAWFSPDQSQEQPETETDGSEQNRDRDPDPELPEVIAQPADPGRNILQIRQRVALRSEAMSRHLGKHRRKAQ